MLHRSSKEQNKLIRLLVIFGVAASIYLIYIIATMPASTSTYSTPRGR